jgi:hypothetical protein
MGRMRVSLLHRKRSQLLTPTIFSSFPGCINELHFIENPIYLFPEKELRGLSPNFHIHVSESDLYISRIGPRIFLQ